MDSSTLSPQLAQKPYTIHNQTPFRSRTLHSRRSAAPRFSASIAVTAYNPNLRLHLLSNEFRSLHEPIDRVKRLLFYAADLPSFPDSDRIPSNRVTGCTAQVWLSASMDSIGRIRFAADSDSEIARGFCACLLSVLDGAFPEDVLAMRAEDLADLNVVGFAGRTHSRVNTWHNVLVSMQKRARALMGQGEGRTMVDPFPSLVLGGDGIRSKTSYNEAQVSVSGQSILHGLSSMET